MKVEVSQFVDTSDRDTDEQHDYCYEGEAFTFRDGPERLVLRTYSDEPSKAFFLGVTCAQADAMALANEAARYLQARGTTRFLCLGPSGTYDIWKPVG